MVCRREHNVTKFTNNSANLTARPKLYRVWVPIWDDGRASLISIWIDPTMAAIEREQRYKDSGRFDMSDGELAEEIEDSRPWDSCRTGSGCWS